MSDEEHSENEFYYPGEEEQPKIQLPVQLRSVITGKSQTSVDKWYEHAVSFTKITPETNERNKTIGYVTTGSTECL